MSQATYIQNHILRRYNVIKKIGSGAYGHVWKVEERLTKKIYALKKIFDAFQHATDAQRTYRQIEILRQTEHPNIITLYQTIKADNNKDVYLIFQYMEADLHNLICQGILKQVHIKFIIYQLAKALKYLHSGSIIHRDLKPSNILVNSNCTIKLCDFGLVRSILSIHQHPVLTQGVATRWYRAPQVLLGSKSYSTPADIWSFGCIVYEILMHKPLFAGNSTLDQIQKICQFTGYPSQEDIISLQSDISKSMLKEIKIPNINIEYYLKDVPNEFVNLLTRMITFNPHKRIKVNQILNHICVSMFHKEQQQIICNKEIRTSIDDNKKFAVDQYRKLIYQVSPIHKHNSLPSSMSNKNINSNHNHHNSSNNNNGTTNNNNNGNNNKYLKKQIMGSSTQQLNKTIHNDKQDLSKKYSYDKFKSVNLSESHEPNNKPTTTTTTVTVKKKFEKNNNNNNNIKYPYSTKQIIDKDKQYNDPIKKESIHHQIQRQKIQKDNIHSNQLPNKQLIYRNKQIVKGNKKGQNTITNNMQSLTNQDVNKPGTISKTFYSPKNYLESCKYVTEHNKNNSGINTYGSSKMLVSKEIKDKSYLFKSSKYISKIGKNQLNSGPTA